MVSISVILPTARSTYGSIIGLDINLFEPTLKSLNKQSFKDFELIVVDCLYETRPNLFKRDPFKSEKFDFPIKHIPVHQNHRFWLDKGMWNVCGALNSGIIVAEGDLIVRMDDASEIPDPNYLKKFWEYYESGLFALALHVRYLKGEPARVNENYLKEGYEAKYAQMPPDEDRASLLKRLYGENGIVRDTRWPIVERAGTYIAPPEWFYGYSSASLKTKSWELDYLWPATRTSSF